jgi:hypothetical protein
MKKMKKPCKIQVDYTVRILFNFTTLKIKNIKITEAERL